MPELTTGSEDHIFLKSFQDFCEELNREIACFSRKKVKKVVSEVP